MNKHDVSKDIQESQSRIDEEPINETKTVEVTVTHEEITIERVSQSGQTEYRAIGIKRGCKDTIKERGRERNFLQH